MKTSIPRTAVLYLLTACSGSIEATGPSDPPIAETPATSGPAAPRAPGATDPTAPTVVPPAVPGSPPPGTCRGGAPRPGPAPLRRLNRVEYDNTVRDLLGDTTRPASAFPSDERALGFDNIAEVLGVTPLLAEEHEAAADRLAAAAVQDLRRLVPCDPKVDAACLRTFITTFGARAFRRPLAAPETRRFEAFAEAQRALSGGDAAVPVRQVVKAMLLSPHFLYRVEQGAPSGSAGVLRLTAHELATRLSYLIWNSMPDDDLFDAAARNELVTPAQVAAHARRMLADPRARVAVRRFFHQWLELERLDDLEKDPKVFPRWKPTLGPLLRREAEQFVDDLVFTRGGSFGDLLRAEHTFLDAALAAFYGVRGPAGTDFVEVKMGAARRSGLLSHAGLLAVHAKPNQTSPIERGRFVREQLLCQALSPPPEALNVTAPDPAPGLTTRERFADHARNPACGGCHRLIDPVGFGFEHHDGIGLWRDTENGRPIDASGELVGTRDADGPFTGVAELGARLAASDEARSCFVTQLFRHAYGRAETDADDCTRAALLQAARAPLRDLLVSLTQNDAFLYRPAVAPAATAGGAQ